jgi:hypothetical protein
MGQILNIHIFISLLESENVRSAFRVGFDELWVSEDFTISLDSATSFNADSGDAHDFPGIP